MKKIEKLTDFEKQVIQKHLTVRLGFDATIEEVNAMNGLIDKAKALQEEIDPEMDGQMAEPDCDLISWFWKQYQAQEADDAQA